MQAPRYGSITAGLEIRTTVPEVLAKAMAWVCISVVTARLDVGSMMLPWSPRT
jgi:hypothetical protein